MKTLRAKLFFSVGAILLLTAILNYGLSRLWIKRQLVKSAGSLEKHMRDVQSRIQKFSSFLMTYRVVEGAAELEGVSKMGSSWGVSQKDENSTAWSAAAEIATYDPQIAFVQVETKTGMQAVLSPKDARLYSPRWAHAGEGILWIEIAEKKQLYAAIPHLFRGQTFYLLFSEHVLPTLNSENGLSDDIRNQLAFAADHIEESRSLPFASFERESLSFSWQDSPDKLFEALLTNETEWIEKMDLIQALVPWQNATGLLAPAGVLNIDPSFKYGSCILADEVFSRQTIILDPASKAGTGVPFLLLRKSNQGDDLDMAQVFPSSSHEHGWMAMGFSLSSIVQKIAELIGKPIIVTWDGPAVGYSSKGDLFDMREFPFEEMKSGTITWQNEIYCPLIIDLNVLQLVVLTPQEQATAVTRFLNDMQEQIAIKVSLSLVGASLFSFFIAILLLTNISKKIAGPIAALSRASEELGKGKYEGLALPKLGHRQDEVAVLTHSFEKMVGALRDRDKIRGVLNKVVSKEISEEILKGNIELGGEERVITMLFSDIRGFTRLAESLQPNFLIKMLNTYMTRMCHVIDETHGVVDKFVGDEIMALYGAPVTLEGHAVKAIEAAIRMIQDLSKWNEERSRAKEPIFEVGIGIHTGLVCTGNMGAENRLNYTVIGSNVNEASRLCSAAEPMQILISEETLQFPGVREKFKVKQLSPKMLKGIDHPVQLYEVIGFK
jgi:class 3 adenylate cyclase